MSGGLRDGMEESTGHPVVLLALNAALSALFSYTVLFLADLGGVTEFTWTRLLGLTLAVMILVFLVTFE
ncbi:MAG: hypothetical protein ACOC2A_03960 [Halanaeroarchaeum sp.]